MKRGLIALLTLFAIATARAADLATTFHFNPSLNHEANPLVKILGFGATGLLWSQVIGGTVFFGIPLLLYWLWPCKRMVDRQATVWEFASLCLYNRRMKKGELLKAVFLGWPLPKDWRQVGRLFGLVLPWATVACSWMAVFSWWALYSWSWSAYRELRHSLAIGYYSCIEPMVGLVVGIIAMVIFFRTEFREANNVPEDTARKLADPQH